MTLQKLELSTDPDQDQAALADLKTILLNRIAELEVALTLEPEADSASTPAPADLIPPASMHSFWDLRSRHSIRRVAPQGCER